MASAACFALRLHASAAPPRGGLTLALGAISTMSQVERARIAVALAISLGACSTEHGTACHTTRPANLFATEAAAALEGSFNHRVPEPLAKLESGASVTVLSDTYGKDYWACYIRTEASVEGWVLCTSLDYARRAAGT